MKTPKLPFKITLERKYNEINIDTFVSDYKSGMDNRKPRTLMVDNDLHVELGKFKTYNVDISELVNIGMRYALNKQEFRKTCAALIQQKNN